MEAPAGWRVESVLLQRAQSRPPTPYLRVKQGQYWIADCATVAAVTTILDLADLIPRMADVWWSQLALPRGGTVLATSR